MSSENLLISLFDFTGNWSRPYEKDWTVIRVDIKNGVDILTFNYKEIVGGYKRVGILAAVPCTDYALSGAKHFAAKDKDGRTSESQKLVTKTKEIIDYYNSLGVLIFWTIENPKSRIHSLNPWLGKPVFKFHPFHFGEPYRKETWLWGKFNIPPIRAIVEPQGIRKGQPDEWYSKMGGKSEETKEYRSRTPVGFAKAFFESNK